MRTHVQEYEDTYIRIYSSTLVCGHIRSITLRITWKSRKTSDDNLEASTSPTEGQMGWFAAERYASAAPPPHTSAYISIRQHTSAYASIVSACVSIRQHTSAYVSVRQRTSAYVSVRQHTLACVSIPSLAYASIRQHTPAYASIRQHTPAYASIRQHTPACVSIRQHTPAYASIRQHTSAYASIRQHTYVSIRQHTYVSIRQHTWRPPPHRFHAEAIGLDPRAGVRVACAVVERPPEKSVQLEVADMPRVAEIAQECF
jgi:hypothetical protein